MIAKQDMHQRLAEIISELDNLARDLAQGTLQVGSHRVRIGQPSSFKLKQKLKDDVVSYDISFQLPVLGAEQGNHRPPEKQPPQGHQMVVTPPSPPTPSADKDKSKKSFAALWKTFVRKVEGDAPIPPADVLLLRELAAGLYADKPWEKEWRNCRIKIEACLEAAADGDFSRARQLSSEIRELTRLCHKQYK